MSRGCAKGLWFIYSHLQGNPFAKLPDAESPSVSSLWYVKENSLRKSRIAPLKSFSIIQTPQYTPGSLNPMDFHTGNVLTEKNNEHRWTLENLGKPSRCTSFSLTCEQLLTGEMQDR